MKTAKGFIYLFAAAWMIISSSCATLVHGSMQTIGISSTPRAWVRIYDKFNNMIYQEKTPRMFVLNRGDGHFQPATYRVEILRKGYLPYEFYINGTVDVGWYVLGNFILGGLIGILIVDPSTGAMWTLSPENTDVNLAAVSMKNMDGNLAIILKEEVPGKIMAQAKRIN